MSSFLSIGAPIENLKLGVPVVNNANTSLLGYNAVSGNVESRAASTLASALDHTQLLNIGVNSHAQIDTALGNINQDLKTTASPTFTAVNASTLTGNSATGLNFTNSNLASFQLISQNSKDFRYTVPFTLTSNTPAVFGGIGTPVPNNTNEIWEVIANGQSATGQGFFRRVTGIFHNIGGVLTTVTADTSSANFAGGANWNNVTLVLTTAGTTASWTLTGVLGTNTTGTVYIRRLLA